MGQCWAVILSSIGDFEKDDNDNGKWKVSREPTTNELALACAVAPAVDGCGSMEGSPPNKLIGFLNGKVFLTEKIDQKTAFFYFSDEVAANKILKCPSANDKPVSVKKFSYKSTPSNPSPSPVDDQGNRAASFLSALADSKTLSISVTDGRPSWTLPSPLPADAATTACEACCSSSSNESYSFVAAIGETGDIGASLAAALNHGTFVIAGVKNVLSSVTIEFSLSENSDLANFLADTCTSRPKKPDVTLTLPTKFSFKPTGDPCLNETGARLASALNSIVSVERKDKGAVSGESGEPRLDIDNISELGLFAALHAWNSAKTGASCSVDVVRAQKTAIKALIAATKFQPVDGKYEFSLDSLEQAQVLSTLFAGTQRELALGAFLILVLFFAAKQYFDKTALRHAMNDKDAQHSRERHSYSEKAREYEEEIERLKIQKMELEASVRRKAVDVPTEEFEFAEERPALADTWPTDIPRQGDGSAHANIKRLVSNYMDIINNRADRGEFIRVWKPTSVGMQNMEQRLLMKGQQAQFAEIGHEDRGYFWLFEVDGAKLLLPDFDLRRTFGTLRDINPPRFAALTEGVFGIVGKGEDPVFEPAVCAVSDQGITIEKAGTITID